MEHGRLDNRDTGLRDSRKHLACRTAQRESPLPVRLDSGLSDTRCPGGHLIYYGISTYGEEYKVGCSVIYTWDFPDLY
jgi:hypothetical protein